MAYTIDDAFDLLKDRAGTRGISSNITPNKFNRWWNSAELKFFNQRYDEYARNQVISDSISKWMSDPTVLNLLADGSFPFFSGMNLLHVDSLFAFLPAGGTGIGGINALVGGSGYTNGSYKLAFTGGSGQSAIGTFVVTANAVTSVQIVSYGTGYALGDTLSAAIPAGTGFTINVSRLIGTKPYKVTRVEKNRWANHLNSVYDAPTYEFPVYTQYSNSFQFAPADMPPPQLVYLQQPIWSKWAYTLNGFINTLAGLISGSGYTNGIYTNVPLTGGAGNSALATIIVSGGIVTVVQVTNPGKLYITGDILSAAAANIGGTGSGFTITVSSIINPRPVYDAVNSIQPKWSDDDVSAIIDLALQDAAQSNRDNEAQQFAQMQSKTHQ